MKKNNPKENKEQTPATESNGGETAATAAPAEDLKSLLEEKERQVQNYYDQLVRLKAEFENYRKRVEKEKENHRLWGKEEVLLKQISLYDIIGQALASAKNTRNVESVIVGLDMIYKEFEKMLADEGITPISAEGTFDPMQHEAVATVEDENRRDGEILAVLQNGYMMNDRILRPAKVKIVKNKNSS